MKTIKFKIFFYSNVNQLKLNSFRNYYYLEDYLEIIYWLVDVSSS